MPLRVRQKQDWQIGWAEGETIRKKNETEPIHSTNLLGAYQQPHLVEKFLRTTRAKCYHDGLQWYQTEDLKIKGEEEE